jgi:hypothetical protein
VVDSDPGIDPDVLADRPCLNLALTMAVVGRQDWVSYISNLMRIQGVVIVPDSFGSSLWTHQLRFPSTGLDVFSPAGSSAPPIFVSTSFKIWGL